MPYNLTINPDVASTLYRTHHPSSQSNRATQGDRSSSSSSQYARRFHPKRLLEGMLKMPIRLFSLERKLFIKGLEKLTSAVGDGGERERALRQVLGEASIVADRGICGLLRVAQDGRRSERRLPGLEHIGHENGSQYDPNAPDERDHMRSWAAEVEESDAGTTGPNPADPNGRIGRWIGGEAEPNADETGPDPSLLGRWNAPPPSYRDSQRSHAAHSAASTQDANDDGIPRPAGEERRASLASGSIYGASDRGDQADPTRNTALGLRGGAGSSDDLRRRRNGRHSSSHDSSESSSSNHDANDYDYGTEVSTGVNRYNEMGPAGEEAEAIRRRHSQAWARDENNRLEEETQRAGIQHKTAMLVLKMAQNLITEMTSAASTWGDWMRKV